jgi:ABC-type multidrug transport system ATPase subunit
MHQISLEAISKRYGYNWILSGITHQFTDNKVHGIAGLNGSGKSTLIKILSGYLSPSEGSVIFTVKDNIVKTEQVFKNISLAAPYTDLIQEYTLAEMFSFHQSFKRMIDDVDLASFSSLLDLPNSKNKLLSEFSSGMKQRTQLALAILSDTPFLLLDEPTAFLDVNAKTWFSNLLKDYRRERCVIIASNDPFDLELCDEVLTIDELQAHS